MSENVLGFRQYAAADYDACHRLFDANCPAFFAENERQDYLRFLAAAPTGYEVVEIDGTLAAAFGFEFDASSARGRVTWIMTSPAAQGTGVGTAMMKRVMERAREMNATLVDIAASHLSAPFFARFGAQETMFEKDGWGPGIDRVDMELREL